MDLVSQLNCSSLLNYKSFMEDKDQKGTQTENNLLFFSVNE